MEIPQLTKPQFDLLEEAKGAAYGLIVVKEPVPSNSAMVQTKCRSRCDTAKSLEDMGFMEEYPLVSNSHNQPISPYFKAYQLTPMGITLFYEIKSRFIN